MFENGLKSAIKGAEALLVRLEKLAQAIELRVHGDLSDTIAKRLEADEALAKAEVAAAIGEGDKDLKRARERVEALNSAIDSHSQALSGLRNGILAFGGDIGKAHAALTAELPNHESSLRATFAKKWEDARAAWSQVLAERRALESLLKATLELPEPEPGTEFDLGAEARRPYELRTQLERELRKVISMNEDSRSNAEFFLNPHAIYIVKKAYRGIRPEEHVCEASLAEGRLKFLVKVGDAYAVKSPARKQGVRDAHAALREIEQTERTRVERADREAERERMANRPWPDAYRNLYPDLSPEEKAAKINGTPPPEPKDDRPRNPDGSLVQPKVDPSKVSVI